MTAELTAVLRQTGLLGALPAADLAVIAAASRLRTFRRGQVVFSAGDPGDTLIVVVSGRVKVVVRSGFEEMKASPWEKEDAIHEDIPILNFLVPVSFIHDNGKLTGVTFQKVKAEYDAKGRRNLVPSGEPDQTFECDDVLVAVGQENAFPWIERDIGIEFDRWAMPVVSEATMGSTNPKVFFGGDTHNHQ